MTKWRVAAHLGSRESGWTELIETGVEKTAETDENFDIRVKVPVPLE
jgi:hypothetical protein